MGTPDFSAVVFEKLNSVYPVMAVVTGNDKPVGRHYELKPCPLKVSAINAGVDVLQYDKVSKEGIDDIKALAPDLIITAAFGQILSDEFLAIAKYGVLNVHASLLPKYRGSSPIQAAILNGDEETGITIMKTVKAVDAGDILLQKKIKIENDDTAGTLFDKLAYLGADAIIEAVKLLDEGKAEFTPQDNEKAVQCAKIGKEDGQIDFNKTAKELDFFVRGMSPWPSAYTHINGKMLKVFEIEKVNFDGNAECGEVVAINKEKGFVVACKDGAIRIKKLQLEGKSVMDDLSFINGAKISVGDKLN
ncbi:MAG: methionyl-tRNA formyltransferase [Clostridia bacterium]|nr:methionyl-tRNA formyltransferase [Clostridia bacterium]